MLIHRQLMVNFRWQLEFSWKYDSKMRRLILNVLHSAYYYNTYW